MRFVGVIGVEGSTENLKFQSENSENQPIPLTLFPVLVTLFRTLDTFAVLVTLFPF